MRTDDKEAHRGQLIRRVDKIELETDRRAIVIDRVRLSIEFRLKNRREPFPLDSYLSANYGCQFPEQIESLGQAAGRIVE